MDTSNASNITNMLPDDLDKDFDSSGCSSTFDLTYFPDDIIADLMFFKKAVLVLLIYILPLILTFGLVGNVSFLFTILRVQSMRTITNAYLASLSIADFCFIIFVGFRYTWTIANSPRVFTNPFKQDVGCILMVFMSYYVYFTSIGLVNLVSYERYLAICHPLKHKYFNSKRRTAKMICATWLVAFLLSASVTPNGFHVLRRCVVWPEREIYHNLPTVLYFCAPISDFFRNYALILQAVCFLIAFGTNIVFYTLIIATLLRRKTISNDKGNHQAQIARQMQRVNAQVAWMLVFNAMAFFVCLTPYNLNHLQTVIKNLSNGSLALLTSDQSMTLYWIATTLNCVNSAINPVIYNMVNPRYRRALLEAFRGCDRNKAETESADRTTSIEIKGSKQLPQQH